MSLRDLLGLYALVGVACAIAVLRRAPARGIATVASALATIPLWPLWAPFALAPGDRSPRGRRASPRNEAAVARVEQALANAVAAVEGSPMADVFPPRAAARIAADVARVASRLDDLGDLEAKTGLDREASARKIAELERSGASDRALATARCMHESLERLEELRASDARALDELADLLEALRAQLLLARYAGSHADGASALVSEVWARVEGLVAAMDVTPDVTVHAARTSRESRDDPTPRSPMAGA